MSLRSSSSVYPTASLAAIFAIGKPVAFEASADDRDTRGFISITTNSNGGSDPSFGRSGFGLTANCTFDPPVSTPTERMIASEASRSFWYSLSVNVIWGATVIESPVCTPIASMFSIEHTMTQLSFLSRTTSSSYSFHPMSERSTWIWLIIEALIPRVTSSSNSARLYAIPPPHPPSVKAGRTIAGSPIVSTNASASSRVSHVRDSGVASPIS